MRQASLGAVVPRFFSTGVCCPQLMNISLSAILFPSFEFGSLPAVGLGPLIPGALKVKVNSYALTPVKDKQLTNSPGKPWADNFPSDFRYIQIVAICLILASFLLPGWWVYLHRLIPWTRRSIANPLNDCAWVLIYNRMKALGELDSLRFVDR